MVLWRISNHANLDGTGGVRASARWHTAGKPVVYLAESPAGALVEALVHLELSPEILPAHLQLLRIEAPDKTARDTVREAELSENWREETAGTRARGDRWLLGGTTPLLQVPSAILPETFNWLFNPSQSGARALRIDKRTTFPIDRRLFQPAR